jgi:PAS domain S-box-containing protein
MRTLPFRSDEPLDSLATIGETLGSVLLTLSQGAPLDAVLSTLVRRVEQTTHDALCSIYQLDATGTRLCNGMAASLSDQIVHVLEGTHITRVGLADVTEIATHPRWARSRTVCLAHGLHTCWSTPVLTGDQELMGLLLVHYLKPHTPTPAEERMVTMAANLAAMAVERERFREFKSRRMQVVMQHMHDGVIAVSTDGRLNMANGAALRVLGLVPPVEGKSLKEAGVTSDLAEPVLRVASGEQAEHRSVIVMGTIHLEVVVSPLETALARRYGAVAILHDVTHQARFRQLQESFVANVSHELRAPLTALSASVEALHDGLVPAERRPRFLKAVLGEIVRMRKLSNKLLTLSRLDTVDVDLAVEDWALQPLLDDIRQLWQERCNSAGLSLVIDDTDVRVRASYEHVQEILANLQDNAIKFTPPGGAIRISSEVQGRYVRIYVADTGRGIGVSSLELVWERFYMEDRARTRSGESGSGLGLSITKRLVELMGGEVGVKSALGQGAVFHFTLPLAELG